MTRAEAIDYLEIIKDDYPSYESVNEALEMAISDMTALLKIRARLNTEYNNTSGDVQAGIAIALGILDRYTKGAEK